MRNLKRALALALSSVMLMGMMVVGTSAAGFDDVTAAHDAEAIEVMQAAGVMVGDDNGNFNPDQKVTRAEAAVVIAKLKDLNVNDFKGADLTFTDVPEWAVPFVAAVQAEGIVAGYSETQFGSNDTVTAAQYALMVMKTMGYFQFESDYGTNWEMATAAQAGKIDLFDDVDAGVKTPLTRNEVARITLNALQTATVEVDGGTLTVESDDIKVTSAHKYDEKTAKSTKAAHWAIDDENAYIELGEELFDGDLTKEDARDDLGRPATRWNWKGEKIGVYAETAAKTVIVTDSADDDAYKAYLEYVNDDFDKAMLNVRTNGVYTNPADTENVFVGDKIEYFMNSKGEIKTAAIIRYGIGQIEEIDTEVSKADKADDVTCYITVDDIYNVDGVDMMKDTKFAGFDAETYVEDAYILYAVAYDEDGYVEKVIASELAPSITGKITAVNKDDAKVKIDGEWYADLVGGLSIGDEIVAYQDLAGQIVAVDEKVNAADDYGYIRHIYQKESNDNLGTVTNTAYVILADGTYASYVIESDCAEDNGLDVIDADAVAALIGLQAYSINSKGELVIETVSADDIDVVTLTKDVDKNNAMIGAYNATSKTEFVFFTDNTGKVKTDVATGYKAVEILADETVSVVYDEDGEALFVFVNAANGNVTSDKSFAVLADNTYAVEKDANGDKYYSYNVFIDGEKTTLNTNCDELAGGRGTVIAYKLDKDNFVIVDDSEDSYEVLAVETVTAANDDYIVVAGEMYNVGDEDRYTIVIELNKANTKVVSTDVKTGATLSEDDNVAIYTETNNGVEELVAIFEIKVIG